MANTLSLKDRKSLRHTFGVLTDTVEMPNLIDIQRSSYEQFLNSKTFEGKEGTIGINDAIKSVFPVKDYAGRMNLKYISYFSKNRSRILCMIFSNQKRKAYLEAKQ